MKKVIILIIGLVVILLTGASFNGFLYKLFNEYEEACLEYKYEDIVVPYCLSNMGIKGYPAIIYNETHNNCCDRTVGNIFCVHHLGDKITSNKTNECEIYHLIRFRENR